MTLLAIFPIMTLVHFITNVIHWFLQNTLINKLMGIFPVDLNVLHDPLEVNAVNKKSSFWRGSLVPLVGSMFRYNRGSSISENKWLCRK